MRDRGVGLTAAWLALIALAQVMALAVMWRSFVRSARGQMLDTIALEGNAIGRGDVEAPLAGALDAVSFASVAVATGAVVFIALARRRFMLAIVVAGLIAGANLTAQVLKRGIVRPDFGVDVERAAAGNSFPSGHTTVAASVAVALVLVLPPRLRGLGAALGAGFAALVGVGTLSAGWHRPSDAVAAFFVVGAWAAAAGIALLVVGRGATGRYRASSDAHPFALAALAIGGVALLAFAALALGLTYQVLSVAPEELSRRRLFVAYAGGACGIVGVASLTMALVLTAVHRVVPRRLYDRVDHDPAAIHMR